MLRKSRFILHKWLMLYQLMLKIAKHQSLNLQEMSLLSYLYSQLSARQWWVFVFIGSADTLYLEKGANTAQLSKIEEWVIFYNWAWHDGCNIGWSLFGHIFMHYSTSSLCWTLILDKAKSAGLYQTRCNFLATRPLYAICYLIKTRYLSDLLSALGQKHLY